MPYQSIQHCPNLNSMSYAHTAGGSYQNKCGVGYFVVIQIGWQLQ